MRPPVAGAGGGPWPLVGLRLTRRPLVNGHLGTRGGSVIAHRRWHTGEVARQGGSVNLGPAFTRGQRWVAKALLYWKTENLEALEERDRVP